LSTARLLALLVLAVTAAACTPDPREQATKSIEDGSAMKAVQQHFDPLRQCAPVLTGNVPIELSDKLADSDSARALVAAGLLVRSSLSSAVDSVRFAPAPDAAKWFVETRANERLLPSLTLCYARRQVTRVWLAEGEAPALRYAYRLIDAPDWTRQAAMVAAFPFLMRALSAEFLADERVPFRDGRWDVSLASQAIRIPGIDAEGFYACPAGHESPPRGCER
jgi:hypothetical protein